MNAKMLKDFKGVLALNEIGRMDVWGLALKHATDKQKKELKALLKEEKAMIAENTPIDDAAGEDITKQVEFTLGGEGTEVAAKQTAMQLKHPNAFQYNSIFPNPGNYRVEAGVVSAEAVGVEGTSPLYPWGVHVIVEVSGPEIKVKGWIQQLVERVHSVSFRM